MIDGSGVEHDPERLATLRLMALPPTGAARQHFLCALNWLRDSMIDYARTVVPLTRKLEAVMVERGRRKGQLAGANLEWSSDEAVDYQRALSMIDNSSKLLFPDRAATVCMFTDASMGGWSVVVTQVMDWKEGLPVHEQQHELLICKGGLFKGAQLAWSMTEKEAYPHRQGVWRSRIHAREGACFLDLL